ncbi:tRNA lysidine(34) synthetase TilS [Methyloprofundus sp.]|uniref:tRNA lysidine(34) synthetase TilS n=1 Tax=Methyloprofundus sp. TaxID=2020875 RepID=UPI003D143A2D
MINSQLALYHSAHTIFIGYSGGIDSHVLLHLLASTPELKPKLCAVYIHHGIQASADDWALHCQKIASTLSVKFQVVKVNAQAFAGQSPEEAARNARYQAFKNLLAKDDVLLFAQHRHDQLETVLLQMFRGAGLKGLSGMPFDTSFAAGRLLRPLLDINQQAIEHYAQQHKLQWIEDPSNQERQFDRNYLRHEIIPLLEKRWPSLDKTVARVAEHCADAQSVLSSSAHEKMQLLYDGQKNSLSISGLLENNHLNQQWIIREWLHHLGARMPTQKVLVAIMQDILPAQSGANPIVEHDGYTIQRYRDALYLVATNEKPDLAQVFTWPANADSLVLTNNGVLQLKEAKQGIAKQFWQHADILVKYRQGGEKISLPQRTGRHSLKKIYQEAGIAPWMRDSIPLIYIAGKLAVVANVCISADFYVENTRCVTHIWQQENDIPIAY